MGVYDYSYVARSGDDGRRDRVSEVVETARAPELAAAVSVPSSIG
jgi:hypothetical protein